MKRSIFPPIAAVLLGVLALAGGVAFCVISTKETPSMPFGFMFFGFSILCAVWFVNELKQLRDHIPDDALQTLGNPIPQDAVDRRWILEIKDAVEEPDYTWPASDPLESVIISARKSSREAKIRQLIYAAKDARGVRLPPRPARSIEE